MADKLMLGDLVECMADGWLDENHETPPCTLPVKGSRYLVSGFMLGTAYSAPDVTLVGIRLLQIPGQFWGQQYFKKVSPVGQDVKRSRKAAKR